MQMQVLVSEIGKTVINPYTALAFMFFSIIAMCLIGSAVMADGKSSMRSVFLRLVVGGMFAFAGSHFYFKSTDLSYAINGYTIKGIPVTALTDVKPVPGEWVSSYKVTERYFLKRSL